MIYLIAILIYLLGLTGILIYKPRQVKTQADFTLAGRSLSPWVMVCTMPAVWIGTGSIAGNAEKAYSNGLAALILPAGTFIRRKRPPRIKTCFLRTYMLKEESA